MQSPSQRDSKALAASVNAELSHEAPCQACLDPHGGLGMYAKRAVAAGERILLEQPLTITPTHDARPFVCANCFDDSRFSSRGDSFDKYNNQWARYCSGCCMLRCCSKACESALHIRHRGTVECEALALLAKEAKASGITPCERFGDADLANLLFQAVRILSDRHAGVSVRAYQSRTVSFSSYTQRLVGGGDDAMVTTALEAVARAALAVIPEAARIPVSDLASVLRYHQANVYSVLSRGGNEIASASFVGALHLFNHSCAPNLAFDCVPIRTAGRAGSNLFFALVSLRNIAPGEALCISYTSTADERAVRRKHLLSYYGFDCDCERCLQAVSPEEDRRIAHDFAARRCALGDCGTGYVVAGDATAGCGWRCLHCGRRLQSHSLEVAQEPGTRV